jgi:hypothetical protein
VPIHFKEHKESGATTANPPTMTRVWNLYGSKDREYVQGIAYSLTPATASSFYGLLYRQDVKVDPNGGPDQWLVTVPYAPGQGAESGTVTFSFDTTGGSFHIKNSLATVNKYPPTATNHKQLIGVHGDDVDGVDVVIPSLKITYGFKHPQGIVTEAYAKVLASVTGRTNSAAFRSFAAGELLFLGATGSDGTDADAEVQYQFAASQAASGLTVGDIMGIAKAGHDVAWVSWEDTVDDGKPAKKPLAVYVEKVYQSSNFAAIFGFG